MRNESTPLPTPAAYAGRLRAAFDGFLRTLALLDAEEMETAQLENGWTPAALLAHIAFWDDVQCTRMADAVAGRPGAWSAVLREGNDERAAAAAHRPFEQVLAQAEANRSRLAEFAAALPPEALAREHGEGDHALSLTRLLAHMVEHTRRHASDLYTYASSMRRWSKSNLRRLIDSQHEALMESIAGLDEATILTTRLSEQWSVRDQLVHLLAWGEYAWRRAESWPALDLAVVGDWVTGEGDNEDTINERLHARRRDLTLIEIVDGLATWHRRLLRKLDEMSDETLCTYGEYGWGGQGELCSLLYSICLHQAEHAEEIWMWRVGVL